VVNPGKRPQRKKPMSSFRGSSMMDLPAAIAMVSNWREPRWKHRSRRGCRLENLELVGSVAGYTTFGESGAITAYRLNPGDASVFSFLSVIAADFDQYTVHGMEFFYVPSTGTATPGSIIMAPDYDPMDSSAIATTVSSLTEQELGSWEGRGVGVAYAPIHIKLDRQDMFPLGPRKYVRATYDRMDLRTTDVGTLVMACYDAASDATTFGKLYVKYDVEFFVPARDSGNIVPSANNSASYYLSSSQTLATGVNVVLGAGGLYSSGVGNIAAYSISSTGVISFLAPGWYWLRVNVDYVNSAGDQITLAFAEIYDTTAGAIVAGGLTEFRDNQGVTEVTVPGERLLFVPRENYTYEVRIGSTFVGGVCTCNAQLSLCRA
jgi:hypothetical protein